MDTRKIMRSSIYRFLQEYQSFTTIAALLALPYCISLLLSQYFVFSFSTTIQNRLTTVLEIASGFHNSPLKSLWSIFSLKISQTISSWMFTFPFSLTFFLISKTFVVGILNDQHKRKDSFLVYRSLLLTFIYNFVVLFSANSTAISILLLGFNLRQEYGLWVLIVSAVVYSVILANTLVTCNLALILAAIEGPGGWMPILKAFVLMRGRASTALSLAVFVNVFMVGIEALFQYRIVRAYGHKNLTALCLEGMLIAYLYSIFFVLDTVVSFIFLKSCKRTDDEMIYSCLRIDELEDHEEIP